MPTTTDRDIGIPAADINIPAYCSMPEGGGNLPVVLVAQEIFGVNDYIRGVCRRLAALGYMAVAPELYARQGDPSQISDTRQLISRIVSRVPDAQVMSDLDAAVAWAKRTGSADTTRLAIAGFCWGGRIVWLYAAHRAGLKAGAAWYGRLVGERDILHPKHPIDVAGDLRAPVLGLYGARDEGIPVATVDQMRAALAEAHQPSEFIVYPNAGHAFHADYRPSYVENAARDGWQRMLAWFDKFGVK